MINNDALHDMRVELLKLTIAFQQRSKADDMVYRNFVDRLEPVYVVDAFDRTLIPFKNLDQEDPLVLWQKFKHYDESSQQQREKHFPPILAEATSDHQLDLSVILKIHPDYWLPVPHAPAQPAQTIYQGMTQSATNPSQAYCDYYVTHTDRFSDIFDDNVPQEVVERYFDGAQLGTDLSEYQKLSSDDNLFLHGSPTDQMQRIWEIESNQQHKRNDQKAGHCRLSKSQVQNNIYGTLNPKRYDISGTKVTNDQQSSTMEIEETRQQVSIDEYDDLCCHGGIDFRTFQDQNYQPNYSGPESDDDYRTASRARDRSASPTTSRAIRPRGRSMYPNFSPSSQSMNSATSARGTPTTPENIVTIGNSPSRDDTECSFTGERHGRPPVVDLTTSPIKNATPILIDTDATPLVIDEPHLSNAQLLQPMPPLHIPSGGTANNRTRKRGSGYQRGSRRTAHNSRTIRPQRPAHPMRSGDTCTHKTTPYPLPQLIMGNETFQPLPTEPNLLPMHETPSLQSALRQIKALRTDLANVKAGQLAHKQQLLQQCHIQEQTQNDITKLQAMVQLMKYLKHRNLSTP